MTHDPGTVRRQRLDDASSVWPGAGKYQSVLASGVVEGMGSGGGTTTATQDSSSVTMLLVVVGATVDASAVIFVAPVQTLAVSSKAEKVHEAEGSLDAGSSLA